MTKTLSIVAALGWLFAYGCGASEEHNRAPDDAGAAGESELANAGQGNAAPGPSEPEGGRAGAETQPVGGSEPSEVGGVPGAGGTEASGAAPSELAGGAAGQPGSVVLPDALIVNQAYSCADTGPFEGVAFESYFYVEDWEDDLLDTPGVSADSSTLSSSFGMALVDSVDCDDGVVDEQCATCNSLWGPGAVEVSFDATTLGALPTHVGLVWTDGGYNASVTIDAYDEADALIYTQTVEGIGDDSNLGTTAEDRFFGIVHYAGVKRVHLANTSGGIEIDHLQYGR